MPRPKRKNEILYQRGDYRLQWDRRSDGTLRSPCLTIFWYDPEKGGQRSHSTGETDLGSAIAVTDRFYVERTAGLSYCPTCGQLRQAKAGYLLVDAIETYDTMVVEHRPSAQAIRARLSHLLDYLQTLDDPAVPCEAIDEDWVARFRKWALDQPIVSAKGKARMRSLSTVENSVIALSAAINDAFRRKNTVSEARFKVIPAAQVNRSPTHRAGVKELAAMFRYCVNPIGAPTDKMQVRWIRERAALRRFLIASVGTMARPDAVHDISTKLERRQWNGEARVLALNPEGRRQTKKYRPVIPVPWQVAHHLNARDGFYVGPASVENAWWSMAQSLKLPGKGQAGMKLIRRSVAKILRDRLPKADWPELEMFLGHRRFESTSDIYAPFDPSYLGGARAALEALIDEIESLVPGAFSRKSAGEGGNVIVLAGRKR